MRTSEKTEPSLIATTSSRFFHQPRLVDGINQDTVWLWLALPAPTIFSFDSSWIRSAKEIISERVSLSFFSKFKILLYKYKIVKIV